METKTYPKKFEAEMQLEGRRNKMFQICVDGIDGVYAERLIIGAVNRLDANWDTSLKGKTISICTIDIDTHKKKFISPLNSQELKLIRENIPKYKDLALLYIFTGILAPKDLDLNEQGIQVLRQVYDQGKSLVDGHS